MEWILMFIVCEGSREQEIWYTNEDETLFRIVFTDGSEVVTDDCAYGDDD